MKFFTLDKFDKDALDKFSNMINKYSNDEHIHIYLNSEGWETIIGEAMVKTINSYPEKFSLSVLTAASAAFNMILKLNCDIEIMESWYAMLHKGGWSVFIRDWLLMESKFAKFQEQQLRDFKENVDYLNKEELASFLRWEDIYFNKERLEEIFLEVWKVYNEKEDLYKVTKPICQKSKLSTETQSKKCNEWLTEELKSTVS